MLPQHILNVLTPMLASNYSEIGEQERVIRWIAALYDAIEAVGLPIFNAEQVAGVCTMLVIKFLTDNIGLSPLIFACHLVYHSSKAEGELRLSKKELFELERFILRCVDHNILTYRPAL